jgi:hypothetical protein
MYSNITNVKQLLPLGNLDLYKRLTKKTLRMNPHNPFSQATNSTLAKGLDEKVEGNKVVVFNMTQEKISRAMYTLNSAALRRSC